MFCNSFDCKIWSNRCTSFPTNFRLFKKSDSEFFNSWYNICDWLTVFCICWMAALITVVCCLAICSTLILDFVVRHRKLQISNAFQTPWSSWVFFYVGWDLLLLLLLLCCCCRFFPMKGTFCLFDLLLCCKSVWERLSTWHIVMTWLFPYMHFLNY